MGLLRRLVEAVEKIANKKDDYSQLNAIISSMLQQQLENTIALNKIQRREQVLGRYNWLKLQQLKKAVLVECELEEIDIGDIMFQEEAKTWAEKLKEDK